jgi:hypothetical protein
VRRVFLRQDRDRILAAVQREAADAGSFAASYPLTISSEPTSTSQVGHHFSR